MQVLTLLKVKFENVLMIAIIRWCSLRDKVSNTIRIMQSRPIHRWNLAKFEKLQHIVNKAYGISFKWKTSKKLAIFNPMCSLIELREYKEHVIIVNIYQNIHCERLRRCYVEMGRTVSNDSIEAINDNSRGHLHKVLTVVQNTQFPQLFL